MDGDKGLKTIITVFVFVIIGAVLIGTLADSIFYNTNLAEAVNESVDITLGRLTGNTSEWDNRTLFTLDNVDFVDQGISAIHIIGNGSALTEDSDWGQNSSGFFMLNSSSNK